MEVGFKSIAVRISDASVTGEARRIAMDLATAFRFDPVKVGEAGIIATELGNNLWRHASGGEIIFRRLQSSGTPAPIIGLEILSIDRGPGMEDVEKCLRDGYSSGGTAGIGLGAVARLSSYSEIFSEPAHGTIIVSHLWATPLPKSRHLHPVVGAVCLPLKGEHYCGDAWTQKTTADGFELLLVDGLGHGIQAEIAADTALETFRQKDLGSREMIGALHLSLKPTVGAVVGVVSLTPRGKILRFSGIGNIEGRVFNTADYGKQSLVSHNGTVGHSLPTVRSWEYSWSTDSVLILHSDGISGKWDLTSHPGLSSRHPSVIAGVLYRDFRRERDDACVVVVREPPARA